LATRANPSRNIDRRLFIRHDKVAALLREQGGALVLLGHNAGVMMCQVLSRYDFLLHQGNP
jgi:hypothetical protein